MHPLALGRARDVGALGRSLATGDGDVRPSPVGAGALGAEDVDIGGGGFDGARDATERQICDWDAGGWRPGGRAVLVVLLNDHAVLGDAREGDAGILDV